MYNMLRAIFLLAPLGLATVSPLPATARTWEIDRDHSSIYFSIDHIYAKVHGRFADFSGTIHFDPANLAASSMTFDISVNSIDTGIGKRDNHLLSEDFFDAAKHPRISFASTSMSRTGEASFNVIGRLTIKGQAYDLSLPLTLAGIKEHPMEKDKEVAGFNGRLIFDRLAHKVGDGTFHAMGLIGKDVDILVTLEVLSRK